MLSQTILTSEVIQGILKNPRVINLIGRRFGRLVVVDCAGRSGPQNDIAWKCQCDCGNTHVSRGESLRQGTVKSCGCLLSESSARRSSRHSMWGTPTYRSWASMCSRCRDATLKCWKNYGGRGIKVCDRWLKFENFFEDMGTRPSILHSIDRYPDKNGNYQTDNCRWATKKQQLRNTCRNRLLTHNGKTQCIADWADELGVDDKIIRRRLRAGLVAKDALLFQAAT